MTGTIGKTLAANPPAPNIVASTGTSSTARPRPAYSDKVVVLPAGFVGDLLSKFSGTIGEVAGGAFGDAALGRTIGDAAGPLVKLLPFSIVPPSVDPASAARVLGLSTGEALDGAVAPRGYRLLAKVPRLPGAVVDRLVDHFGTLQKLLSASIDDLQAVDGVGELRARSVREGLSRLAESTILERYV